MNSLLTQARCLAKTSPSILPAGFVCDNYITEKQVEICPCGWKYSEADNRQIRPGNLLKEMLSTLSVYLKRFDGVAL